MKKIYLFCSNGMSTSLLAQNMQDVANAHNLPFEVKAFPIGTLGEIIESKNPDCIFGEGSPHLMLLPIRRRNNTGRQVLVISFGLSGQALGAAWNLRYNSLLS